MEVAYCLTIFFLYRGSPRFQLVESVGAMCSAQSRIVGQCVDRIVNLEDDVLSAATRGAPISVTSFAPELRAAELKFAQMHSFVADVAAEPTLWRAPLDATGANRFIDRLQSINARCGGFLSLFFFGNILYSYVVDSILALCGLIAPLAYF